MCGDYEVSLLPCSLREMEFLCETNCPSLVAEFGGVVKEATERHRVNFTCRSWKLLHWKLYCCCTSRESLPDSQIQKLCCAILYFLSFFGTRIPPHPCPASQRIPVCFNGGKALPLHKDIHVCGTNRNLRNSFIFMFEWMLSCQLYVFQIYLGILLRIFFLVHVSFFVADFIMPQWDDVWSLNSSIDLCTTKGTYGEEKAAGWRADSVPGCSGC